MVEHNINQRRNSVIEQKLELEARLSRIRANELQQKLRYESGEPKSKRIVSCRKKSLIEILTIALENRGRRKIVGR